MKSMFIAAVIAALALGGIASDAVAQSKKKSNTEKSEQQQQPAQNSGWYQPCEGTLFLMSDSGSGPNCRRRDGKICTVVMATGGNATLENCR